MFYFTAHPQNRPKSLSTNNGFSFVLPFINGNQYAIISTRTANQKGGLYAWINSGHPKIKSLLDGIQTLESIGYNPISLKRFLFFLHKEHVGWNSNPEYLDFLGKHQETALMELVNAGVISPEIVEEARLTADDLATFD